MPYGECKIYFDGSHYIGIPHPTRPSRRREKPPEEKIVVTDKEVESSTEIKENFKEEKAHRPTTMRLLHLRKILNRPNLSLNRNTNNSRR